MTAKRPPLPIDEVLPAIVTALRGHGVAVVRAPTGAGKTTRVPIALLDAGFAREGRIVLLEPRRVAARAAARRMAHELGEPVGRRVGYTVRFDRKTGPDTRVEVVTEGVLLRRLQRDPFLDDVSTVIFDELHEQTVDAELALAMVRKIRAEVRDDLRIVAMSATLDVDRIAAYLGDGPIVESVGTLHPVSIEHRPHSTKEPLAEVVADVVREALDRVERDILVFLPGRREIHAARNVIATSGLATDIEVLELYGDLPAEAQDRVLRSSERRRVILATNVAESSVTIEGVHAVVDTGLVKQLQIDRTNGLNRLVTTRVSRASADQRAGRAGRLAAGVCYRLFSSTEDRALEPRDAAEMTRVDLTGVALQLRAWGESDLTQFGWLTPPPAEAIDRADDLLELLGATRNGHVTPLGSRLHALPLHPRLALIIAASERYGHVERLALLAALLSERDPFPRRPLDAPAPETESDLVERARTLERYARDKNPRTSLGHLNRGAARFLLRARDQLRRLAPSSANPEFDADEASQRALLEAFPDRIARRRVESHSPRTERGVMVGGRGVRLAPSCGVRHSELFLCLEVDAGAHGRARNEAWVHAASAIDRDWIPDRLLRVVDELKFDVDRRAVRAVREHRCLDLVLDHRDAKPSGEQLEPASELLAEHAAKQIERALALHDPTLRKVLTRIQWLGDHRPELELPRWDEADFLALLPSIAAGKTTFSELRSVRLLDYVHGGLDRDQAVALEKEAPERWTAPSGSRIAIEYERGKPPIIAVRIQEIYGLHETPTFANGRVPALLHLLAPNHRPQQVTDDLPSFWANTYPRVRKDLRGRYPRHAWPEDPLGASPQRRPRRK